MTAQFGEEWRRHWKLVLAGALGGSASPVAVSSLGVFMPHLESALGMTRAEVSSGLTIYAVCGLFCAPMIGVMIDRWGPRPIALWGLFLDGAAFALFGLASGSFVQWLSLWLLFSLCTQGTRTLVWIAAVSRVFDVSRGLAISSVLAGAALGMMLAPILADYLINRLGWRTAYVILGLGWGWFSAAFCYVFFHIRPTQSQAGAAGPAAPPAGMTAREALTSSKFFRIGLTVLIWDILVLGLTIHMVPLLVWRGAEATGAATLVGLASSGSMIGALGCGVLLLRIRGNLLSGIIAFLPIVTCLLLLVPANAWLIQFCAVMLITTCAGAQQHLFAYHTTRYFGLRAYGVIYGTIGSLTAVAIGTGPLVGGYVYDVTQAYTALLVAGIPICVVAAGLMLSLGPYPEWPTAPDQRVRRREATA